MIFAGGEPRVRTEGFGICVANDNLPQRSPNMKKDPMGRFLCLIIFSREADLLRRFVKDINKTFLINLYLLCFSLD